MGQAITPMSGSIKKPSQTSCSTQRNLSNGRPSPSLETFSRLRKTRFIHKTQMESSVGADVKIVAGCSNWFVLFSWSIWFNETNQIN